MKKGVDRMKKARRLFHMKRKKKKKKKKE